MAEKRSSAHVAMPCPPPPEKRAADALQSTLPTPYKYRDDLPPVLSHETCRAVTDIGVKVIVDTCNLVGRDAELSIFSSDDAEGRVFAKSVVLLETFLNKTFRLAPVAPNNSAYDPQMLVAVPLACFLLALRTLDFRSPEHKFLIDLMNTLEVPPQFKFTSLTLESTERKLYHVMHSEVDTPTAMDVLDNLPLPTGIAQHTMLRIISSIKAAYCHARLKAFGPRIIALGALHANGVHVPTSTLPGRRDSDIKCLRTFIDIYHTHLKNVTRYV